MSMRHMNPVEEFARLGQQAETAGLAAALEKAAAPMPTTNGPDGGSGAERAAAGTPTANGESRAEAPAGATPAANGGNGRDEAGRFAAGNKGGPGNPFARQVAALRKAMLEAVTHEDMKEIFQKAVTLAKGGNVQAMKFVASYTTGKPVQSVDPDQLDAAEWKLFKEAALWMDFLPQMIMRMSPERVLSMLRFMRPVADEELSKKMAHALAHPETVLPPVPELVMGRSDQAAGRGAKSPAGTPAARAAEHEASALERAPEPTANGGLSESRRRAWALTGGRFGPSTNGLRRGQKGQKKGKPPAKGHSQRSPGAHAHGAPSTNGVPGS